MSDPLRLTEPTFVEDVYGHAINVVSAFGLVYVARGLDGARRRPDVVSVRGLGTILTVVVLLGAVATMLPAFVFGADELLTLGNVVALIMSVFVTLAWCYLFVIALGGWSAGESPRLGWLLVTIAAAIEILFRLLISVSGLLDISQAGAIVLWIISLAFVAGVGPVPAGVRGGPAVDGGAGGRRRRARDDSHGGGGDGGYGRSAGSDASRFRSRLRPSSTCSVGA